MTASKSVHAFAAKFGAGLVERRRARKLNQEQFAAEAGISKAYLSQIEAGKRLPSLAMLIDIAEALDVELRELL